MSARIHFNHKEVVFSQSVQRSLQLELLSVPELNCCMCGLAPGEIDWTTGRKARLHIDRVRNEFPVNDKSSVISITCSICQDGREQLDSAKLTSAPSYLRYAS